MIKKPKRPSKYTNKRELIALLNVSEERLRSIQDAVIDAADWHLEDKIRVDMQESHKWEQFTNEVVTSFPELKNCQDYWPLHGFISLWKRRNRSSEKKLGIQYPTTPPLHDAPRRENRMMFIGKPLPRRIRFHKHRNVHGSMSTDTAQVALIAGSSNLRNELSRSMDEATALRQDTDRSSSASHQNLGKTVLSYRSRSASLVLMKTGSTRSENDTSDNASEVDSGLVACLFCDYTPNGTVAGKPAIDNVFQHNKHVIDSLSTLGICNDQQLDALMDLRMWGIGPDRFFDSIPASELSPLYKAHILSQLKAKQGLILRPPLAIEVKRRIEGSMSFSSEVRSGQGTSILRNEARNEAGHSKSVNSAQYRVPWSGCPTHPPTPEWDHVPTKLQ
ncbi:hypothetical protein E4T56_gene11259, partial [Termitomyces sp. T112]